MSDALAALISINLDDLVAAFGWKGRSGLTRLARLLFRSPARNFARQMLRFDALIADRGLADAACISERQYARSLRVYGRGRVPAGPVLFLSNHPGVTDTLALLACLNRDDLRVIALDRPFLLSLPNLSQHLAFVTDEPAARVSLVRRIGAHLRRGGAVLTFPAGRNELDPDISGRAAQSLAIWTDSADVFARLAPDVAIVPVCVRGVFWSVVARFPLVRLRRSDDDQQLLGSALQLLSNVALGIRPVAIRIEFGQPIRGPVSRSTGTAVLHRIVIDEMRRLMENAPAGEGEELL